MLTDNTVQITLILPDTNSNPPTLTTLTPLRGQNDVGAVTVSGKGADVPGVNAQSRVVV